jgi:hypothetical protein
MRKFNPSWFKEFESWLEYSEHDGGAYCLCGYLFNESKKGGDAFITEGSKVRIRRINYLDMLVDLIAFISKP